MQLYERLLFLAIKEERNIRHPIRLLFTLCYCSELMIKGLYYTPHRQIQVSFETLRKVSCQEI